MVTIIGGANYTLDKPIKWGGEGEIYKLDQKSLAKIYYPDIINTERRLKVLSLCTSFSDNINHFGTESFAFPQKPAYEDKEVFDRLSGFSMSYFKDLKRNEPCPDIDKVCFDLNTNDFKRYRNYKFDDAKAVDLIYNIFDVVDRLHKSRIILGDVNTGNILYNQNSGLPVIIDLDSAQIGLLRCLACSDEYLDPIIQEQGKDSQGSYTYSFESDIFSIACVCYEFFIGANPFFVQTKPSPKNILYNKENGICILRFCHSSTSVLNGVQCLPTVANSNIETRLRALQAEYPELFEFFISIFIDNNRTSLLHTLNLNDPRHPAYIFHSQLGFDNARKQIVEARKELIAKHKSSLPISQITQNVSNFAPLDLGFSKIVHAIPVNQLSTNYNVALEKNNDSDQKELAMFLSNYGSDISEMTGDD